MKLQNGKEVCINAPQNSAENKYVKSKEIQNPLNSNTNNRLSHSELLKGATIDFEMNDSVNKARGTSKTDFPYSLSNEK